MKIFESIMRKHVFTLATVALLALTACKNDSKNTTSDAIESTETSIDAEEFNVDTQASKISWEGGKLTGSTHNGTISLKEGILNVKDGKIENGIFVIDMNSINVEDLESGDGKEDLEAHLKGTGKEETADHFFNVTKYPEATFELVSVKEDEQGQTTLIGNLTIKEITRSIEFPASIHSDDNTIMIHASAFPINRTEFNVNFNSNSVFDGLGDKAIKDNINVSLHIEAKK